MSRSDTAPHVEMFLKQQREAWDSDSAHNCIVCFWKPLWFICLLLSFPEGSTRSEFRRDLYEHDHLQQQRWKEPPGETSADLHPRVTGSFSSKPATRRLKAALSQGLHYGTFVKRRFRFVWREKKNQVLLGKAGVVLLTSVKAPSITLLPLRATDALKTREL